MNSARQELGGLVRLSTLRGTAALCLTAILSTACVAWRPSLARPDVLIAQHPEQVRVSLEHGGRVVLYSPTVSGDDLLGYRRPAVEASRIAIPLRDVLLLEVARADAPRTAMLAGAATFTGIVVVGAAQWRSAMVRVRLF
jgi:hypothetical protein